MRFIDVPLQDEGKNRSKLFNELVPIRLVARRSINTPSSPGLIRSRPYPRFGAAKNSEHLRIYAFNPVGFEFMEPIGHRLSLYT
jgi:hypothetical protein